MDLQKNDESHSPKDECLSAKVKKGVWIKTFGCQMNEYDSEKMLGLLSSDYERVDSPEKAEVAIVNTCSVREKAEHKLYSLLGKLKEIKDENPEMIIGVGGCVAQQEGSQIATRSKAVDFVVGTHNLSLVPSLVQRAKQGFEPSVAVDYREEWEDLPAELAENRQERGFRALVAIQRGCNKHCSFCVVPNTRGPQVSREADEIVREITLKARLGAKEVLLLGQTVNSYGLDLSPRVKFEELIRRIADVEGVERIRFTSPHPQEVRKGFIELYGDVPQLCPHIHLPLQAGSDRILKLMNRNYRSARFLDIVAELKERCENLAITSDIIVGFPTETEEDFQDTLEIMRTVKFSSSYSFRYSKRPGTAALSFSEAQEVELEVAKDRLQRLQALQTELSLEVNQKWKNKVVEVLVEGPLKKIPSATRGRIPQNTLVELLPEENSSGNSSSGNSSSGNSSSGSVVPEVGSIVSVKINRVSPHGLRGTVLE